MTNNLKIEVLVSNIPEDGSIASQFPSQEYVNQQLAKKANLSPEGRLDPSHAPDYTEIPGLYEHIEDTKDEIEISIANSLQDAKGYTNQQLSTGLQTKADLVNGKIPFDQIPFSADIEDQIQINVENITAVVDQKVAQVVEQVNGVATAANSYTDTKVAENKTYVDTTIGNVIEDVTTIVDTKAVSKAVTIPTYLTPEAGVAAGTGVAAGSYYNVRSTEDDTMFVEYQNVGGSAVATGKLYLSALGVQQQEKSASMIKDESGENQQQINNKKIDSPIVKVSQSIGVDNYSKMRSAIIAANSKNMRVDIDVNVVVPSTFNLVDMLDVYTDVYSSNNSTITYSKYGIPIFLIKKQCVNFGDGLTLVWSGVTPSDARAPYDFGTLKAAMGFNVSYDYNRNTSTAPVVFLGVSGSCLCDFTITNEANLIYVCIASLPATPTSLNSLHLDCLFDGIIFGLNSQNFDGLTGTIKGKRYGNIAATGTAPGHLIYLTQASNLPVWSRNINIFVDDTQAKCATPGLNQDDCSIKLLCVEAVNCVIHSNRPHGAFDLMGKNVNYTIFSNRNINRVGTERSPFAFRIQAPTLAHPITGGFDSNDINGLCVFDSIDTAGDIPILVTNHNLQDSTLNFFGKVKAGRQIATLSGNNSKINLSLNYIDPENIIDSENVMGIAGGANCVNLVVSVDTLKALPKPIRFSRGDANVGDVTLIDVTASINSDTLIKRYTNSAKFTHKQRVSGASTSAINIPYAFGYGDYEITLIAGSDARNSIYKSSAIVSIGSSGGSIYVVDAVGAISQKWTLSYATGILTVTPASTESSNINVSIDKR